MRLTTVAACPFFPREDHFSFHLLEHLLFLDGTNFPAMSYAVNGTKVPCAGTRESQDRTGPKQDLLCGEKEKRPDSVVRGQAFPENSRKEEAWQPGVWLPG